MTLDTGRISEFAEALEAEGREALDPAQLSARLRIDAELHPREVRMELASQLRRLAPFGAGNPEPVFFCRDLAAHEVRLLPDKKGTGPGHLKLRLGEVATRVSEGESIALEAIGFNLGGTVPAVGTRLDAAFQLAVDTWNGSERLQLKVKDLRM